MTDTDATPRRKTARVFLNEAKNRQTTHWDVDLLPEAELDRLRRAGRRARWQRRLAVAALVAGVIAVAAAVTAAVLAWVIPG